MDEPVFESAEVSTPAKRSDFPLLLSLSLRSLLFVFLLSTAFAFLYISGCFQLFLDNNLTLVLRVLAAVSAVQGFISLACVAETLTYTLMLHRPSFLFLLILEFIALITAVGLLLLSRSILFFAGGMISLLY